MIIAVLSGFIVALLSLVFGEKVKSRFSKLLALFPLLLFIYFATYILNVSYGNNFNFKYKWIPSLGINMDFNLDGLSLLFSLLITGIGTLVFAYASSYLKGHKYTDRFYCYLSIFMAAMLGLVLSDNALTLFVFWELTSISSFFLIGFNNDNEESRKSSLLALSITGLGGFFLLAGFILIGSVSGTYSIQEMLTTSELLKNSHLYEVMVFLLFAGAFTKSAQFPFHFWLPGAMKAPTPVSAYLHSATMVKAGVYLIARFTPVMGGVAIWNNTLMIVGGFTMLYAAFQSLFKTDLKGVLAYSTISALGVLFFLLGIGTDYAIIAVAVFIIVHALYKAALFLITGIIDHETHTRDVTVLSGLRKVMPPVAIAGVLAAFSNAGIPLTFGFIGKDLIYESTLQIPSQTLQIILTSAAFLTNILLLYAGFVVGIKPFRGILPQQFEKVHLPHTFMWLPPLLLGIAGLFYGLFPSIADEILVRSIASAIKGEAMITHLKIWHGFNIVLLLSVGTIGLGLLLYYFKKPAHNHEQWINKFHYISPRRLIESGAEQVRVFAFRYTRLFHNGYLRIYLMVIIVFFTGLVGYKLFADVPIRVNTQDLMEFRLYELVVVAIMVVAILLTVITSSRLTALAAMSVVGYCICLVFVFYGAPDLAMTQFTIDTLTVVLFALVMFKLPSYLSYKNLKIQVRDAVIAASFGILVSLITLQALVAPAEKEISKYYAENTYTLAKGKNAVNVILVDFRGFDTMVETIVLSIAAIGVYSMLKLNIKSSDKE